MAKKGTKRARVRPVHVFLHSTQKGLIPTVRVGIDFPGTLRGSTQNFGVYYDPSLGTDGQAIADGVLAKCESDYSVISGYFGGITLPQLPVNLRIVALSPGQDGTGGAYHHGCDGVDLYCDVLTTPSLDVSRTNMLVVAEEVEVFSAAQAAGWDCGASNGEGLSRVLATDLYPGELDGYTTAAAWLDSPDRPDFVNNTDPTDTNPLANGCAVLFLNYLRFQLNNDWGTIVQAAAPTLGQTYANLQGAGDGFQKFSDLMEANFPAGSPSGVTTDNPFPL